MSLLPVAGARGVHEPSWVRGLSGGGHERFDLVAGGAGSVFGGQLHRHRSSLFAECVVLEQALNGVGDVPPAAGPDSGAEFVLPAGMPKLVEQAWHDDRRHAGLERDGVGPVGSGLYEPAGPR